LQFGDDLAQSREHRPPILDAGANLGEDVVERLHGRGALRRIVDLIDVAMDKAFAAGIGGLRCFKIDKPARGVAPHLEYRVNKRTNFETAAVEFADNRIHQEGHIVIDDFKHRNAACAGDGLKPHLWSSGSPLGKKGPRLLGDICQFRHAAVP